MLVTRRSLLTGVGASAMLGGIGYPLAARADFSYEDASKRGAYLDVVNRSGASVTAPIQIIHASLLPNGKVLGLSGASPNTARNAVILDLATTAFGPIRTLPYNGFCAGHAHVPNGVFVVGGTTAGGPDLGENKSFIYNWRTDKFVPSEACVGGRWYPTATTLGDGRILIIGGIEQVDAPNRNVQIFDPKTGKLSAPVVLDFDPDLYPRVCLLNNGEVLLYGGGAAANTRVLYPNVDGIPYGNVGSMVGAPDLFGNAAVPLTFSKWGNNWGTSVLSLGGGWQSTTNLAQILYLFRANDQSSWPWTEIGRMAFPRVHHHAVLTPGGGPLGRVVIIGGVSDGTRPEATSVRNVEFLDPLTWEIKTGAYCPFLDHVREYHSIALLLHNGCVLVLGGNTNSAPWYNPRIHLFVPPELITPTGWAPRPSILAAPSKLWHDWSFPVTVSTNTGPISHFMLVTLPSITHGHDSNQRMFRLECVQRGNVATVSGPPPIIAPIGPCMLFAVNKKGVPSLAWFVQLG